MPVAASVGLSSPAAEMPMMRGESPGHFRRIKVAVSYPPILGIWMSMNTRSKSPTAAASMASRPSATTWTEWP